MSTLAAFAPLFQKYLTDARTAQAEARHHDYRRSIFLSFLYEAFNIKADEVDIEKFLKIDVRKIGWIDALFRDLVFEFKRDLTRERNDGLRELRDYLRTLEHGAECVGLLTDGLIFEVYTLEAGTTELRKERIDEIDLSKVNEETAFLWLDSYLFSQKNAPPTSADIVRRFGAQSPTFQAAAHILEALLDKMQTIPAVAIKRAQWRSVLSKVYGSEDIGSDDLFVRHTFLNQFAKLLAYAALQDGIPRDDDVLIGIITGDAFNRFGVSNLGEIDFFAWVLDDPTARSEVIAMLRRLADSLIVYDLTKIDEDLLKQLYQNLVDPETRHDLGEFYTPDWLAELTLQEIDYRAGQSLLDPSCGSGTFLFLAIRRLAAAGLKDWALVDFALENIVGMDVHPLAVTVARINYLLAIIPHRKGTRASHKSGLVSLPVYMADTLRTPEEKGNDKNTLIVNVDIANDEKFRIPVDAAQTPAVFNAVIEQMDEFARYPVEQINLGLRNTFLATVKDRFGTVQRGALGSDVSASYWGGNLTLLNKLIHEGRNSIWAYMLKNSARPLLLSEQKFDVIVGNPPWLTYKGIKDKTYQKEVKDLALRYGLIKSGERKLMTQIELSTLFMVHCEASYLREGGLIAFVMPRTIITGARQHRLFQERGFTRVLDLLGVFPLFNIPSGVLIRRAIDLHLNNIPTTAYTGRLPAHQMSLDQAQAFLTSTISTTHFVGAVQVTSPYYYDRFKNGATLNPRNLCFVRPQQTIASGDAAVNPAMETDPEANAEAKVPWKDVLLKGLVYNENLYATLLSKNLMPFGYRKLHLVALPMRLDSEGRLKAIGEYDFLAAGHSRSWTTWFAPTDEKWTTLKKDTSQIDHLIDQYNYMQKLTNQRPEGVYKVLYNTSGVHITSCVIDVRGTSPKVYEYPTQSFVVDTSTYYYETVNVDEAHYLCALLNAPIVDETIKTHQSRGKGVVGQRHIHRTPFETCAIAPFDPANADHIALARLSQAAHAQVAATPLTGQVVMARRQARAAVESQIAAIDEIARRVLPSP
ncbi:MAG: N-6 DNA methylase [Chloroflexota bacterium]